MIIGISGSIAAGKETLTEFLRKKGFIYIETRKILEEELEKRNLELTRENLQNIGDELRKREGVGVLMKRILDKIDIKKNYIIDSIRNSGEVDFLRKAVKDFVLIGIDAPQKLRFERIMKRGKPGDPKTWKDFLKMDERDFFDKTNPMGQQTGKCIKIADFVIINDGSLEDSMKKIEKVWLKIMQKTLYNYFGVIIEESLEDKSILKNIKIIKTDVEEVTPKHETPWIRKWTLHTVEIPENKAQVFAENISKALDKEHNWYADFKNKEFHYIIFRKKVFKIDVESKEEYDKAKEYGISLGIPEYQVDFHPEIKDWER